MTELIPDDTASAASLYIPSFMTHTLFISTLILTDFRPPLTVDAAIAYL